MNIDLVKDLPVWAVRKILLKAVCAHTVTIVQAMTGAGKSILVPILLQQAGYRVVVTQPRRPAARNLAQRVAYLLGGILGGLVGFVTGDGRKTSSETKITYCTDGLQLVRELSGGTGRTGGRTVLVIDEVHEWNLNIEVLVAWVRQRIEEGDDIKVVLMSATLDAERLSSYFSGAPIVSVEGRLFPVERRTAPANTLIEQVELLAKNGKSILVFQPGKKEIEQTVGELKDRLRNSAIILPLHGGLSAEEQQRCFEPAPEGKVIIVVATNIAQTSITIPYIDAVVDSGDERRVELLDGVEGLYLKPISQADCKQRAGRAGRVKPGIYVLCSDTGIDDRPEFPKAEILRSSLALVVLRLMAQRIDATKLRFYHQPDETVLAEAKKTLIALGAVTKDGAVTKTGRLMARLPVGVHFSRMVVEAEQRGVVDDVLTIAAILEVGGISDRTGKWRALTNETESDLMAQLDIWNAARGKRNHELRDMGIFGKDFFRAKEIRRKLVNALRSSNVRFGSSGNRMDILKACVAGMVDHLYRNEYGDYQNGDGRRQKARESVIYGSPEWIVGLPKDIQFKGRRGSLQTLNLVAMCTKVDPSWLTEVAPQLVKIEEGLNPNFDSTKDSCVSTTITHFNGQQVKEEVVADPEHDEAANVFTNWLANQMV